MIFFKWTTGGCKRMGMFLFSALFKPKTLALREPEISDAVDNGSVIYVLSWIDFTVPKIHHAWKWDIVTLHLSSMCRLFLHSLLHSSDYLFDWLYICICLDLLKLKAVMFCLGFCSFLCLYLFMCTASIWSIINSFWYKV